MKERHDIELRCHPGIGSSLPNPLDGTVTRMQATSTPLLHKAQQSGNFLVQSYFIGENTKKRFTYCTETSGYVKAWSINNSLQGCKVRVATSVSNIRLHGTTSV